MKNKERTHYFDVAKGMFILLLLLHHLKDASNIYGVDMPYFKLTSQWQSLYTAFFMQGFFFVSGYCSNFNKSFMDFLKRNVRNLLLPLVTFSFLTAIIESIVLQDNTRLESCCDWKYWIIGSPLWFLSALFLSKIFVWVFMRYVKNELFIMLASIVFIPVALYSNKEFPECNVLCIYHTMASVFFVYLGCFLKKHNVAYKQLLKYCVFIYPMLIVGVKLAHYDIPSLTAGLWVKWYETPLFLLTSLSGIFASLAICKWINKNKMLEFYGRNSLIVYGVHFSILSAFSYYLYNYVFIPESWIYGALFIILVIVLTVVCCSALIYIFNKKYICVLIGK